MKSIAVAVILAVAMVAFMAETGRAIDCSQVKAFLVPCVSYLANGGNPTPECCKGVSNIQKNTPTVAQRQDACQCIKDAASLLPKIDETAASNLPAACKVQINIPISKDTDCKS
ncbi:hypothetical protein FNV43_RR14744 [Rhamnella rubrinervis]|uniref:Non-specific lipid-transfer protein n=1 Tax=Rhamnella rubrinervis TaxID=2594499 RepID=A0A8K0H3D1_9ROSA|nr:hypothetical protein FNV43_RR14744 [Rhamnella rubrinervis]